MSEIFKEVDHDGIKITIHRKDNHYTAVPPPDFGGNLICQMREGPNKQMKVLIVAGFGKMNKIITWVIHITESVSNPKDFTPQVVFG